MTDSTTAVAPSCQALLRPYQREALAASKRKLEAGVKRQLLVLPTGTGKTVVFANLPTHHGFRRRILVLVHREELASQAADKIARWNPEERVGVEMGASFSGPLDRIVVASVPTIGRSGSRRIQKFSPEDFDCLVCDEAHHSTASTYKNVFAHFGLLAPTARSPLLLGVTATPNRSDGAGLNEVYDDIVYDMPLLTAIREGWLADVCGIRVRTHTSLDDVKTRMGDFAENELAAAVNTPERNQLIVREWQQHAAGRQTVAFTVDIAHAQALAKTFQAAGIRAAAVWGSDGERASKLAQHRGRGLQVLTNCAVLTEGYDDWRISCIVLARPTKSQLLFTQMAGRGTRIPDGINNLLEAQRTGLRVEKSDCLLMDVVDNTSRHRLVTTSLLFGLGAELDLAGTSASDAKERLDAAYQDFPYADFSGITNLEQLKGYAEKVDLFQVHYCEEVQECSDFTWRKHGDDTYILFVNREDTVHISKDLRDVYRVTGVLNQQVLDYPAGDLAGAFELADTLVVRLGGNGIRTLLARKAKWHDDDPSEKQLALCRKLHIPVPASATKGDVRNAIDNFFARRRM